jgi:aspartate/methionine/tyrosine aminotransferase
MAQLARKYKFILILDIVYHQLYRNQEPIRIPFEALDEHVFIVNSFSKTLSITGWRLGYLACHQSHFEALCNIHDFTGLNSPAPLQEAVWRFINAGLMPEYTSWLRSQLVLSYQCLHNALLSNHFTISETGGGYFIWAKLPEPFTNGFKFAVDLYDTQKVAVVPGIHFSSNAHNFIRFNFARPLPEIKKAIEGISNFIKTENQCNP